MIRAHKRLLALGAVLLALVLMPFACAEKTPPRAAPAPPPAAPADTTTPREIELSDAKMTFRNADIAMFEVKYRFTKGQPQIDHEYHVHVAFPGTTNSGIASLTGRQLKKEGVLKDGFQLSQPGAKAFEIKVLEAPSPRDTFHKISNVATGTIQ